MGSGTSPRQRIHSRQKLGSRFIAAWFVLPKVTELRRDDRADRTLHARHNADSRMTVRAFHTAVDRSEAAELLEYCFHLNFIWKAHAPRIRAQCAGGFNSWQSVRIEQRHHASRNFVANPSLSHCATPLIKNSGSVRRGILPREPESRSVLTLFRRSNPTADRTPLCVRRRRPESASSR